MRIYQIYMPELATFVKFKVLEPESVQAFLVSLPFSQEELNDVEYYISFRKSVIENFVFNLKGEVSESLRMMSRKAAENCLDALYTGCVMLNPGLDVDGWINLSYTPTNGILDTKPVPLFDERDDMTQEFLDMLKKFKNKKRTKV